MKNGRVEPFVSVVTPVYNGARYLSQSVESVLAQTYQNWEYVIVDNCSTDRTLEIAQGYADQDPRIRIHNNSEFLPVIRNFNHATRLISNQSKYCKAVHADDFLFPECLSKMVSVAEAYPNVGVVGAYSLYGTRVELDGLPYPSTVVSGREMCRSVLLGHLRTFGSPTTVLMRSDIVRSRSSLYDEAELHADRAACYDLLASSDYGFVHEVLTFSRVHEESITNTVSRRFYAGRLADVAMLKKYGRLYLTEEEYKTRFAIVRRRYYAVLAREVLRAREKKFWDYHRTRLAHVGESLKVGRLANAVGGLIIDALLNPKNSVTSLMRKLADRSGSEAGSNRQGSA